MDKLLFIKQFKNMLNEIMITYPKCLEILREENELKIELAYPLNYEYSKYYNKFFSSSNDITINLKDDNQKLFQKHLMDLLKIKRFLRYKSDINKNQCK